MSQPTRRGRRTWRRVMRTPTVPASPDATQRTCVLLECAPERSPMVVATILDRADLDVIVCEGPPGSARCPVAAGGTCSALDRADVVVNALGDATPERAEVLPATLAAGVEPASVIAMGRRDDPGAASGIRRLGADADANALIAEIRAADPPVDDR